MTDIAQLQSGTPQFRIKESLDFDAPTYFFFGQPELESDLIGMKNRTGDTKHIRTFDNVCTLKSGDLVFSLISGKAAIVGASHDGYLYTQNYVKLSPSTGDAKYLAYMLNEDADIKRQLQIGQQGSVTLKFTIKQLNDLLFPAPIPVDRQRAIGKLYFNQLRLTALKQRIALTEATLLMDKLREASK